MGPFENVRRYRRLAISALVAISAGLYGCSDDKVVPFAPANGADAEGLYWSLTLDHDAVTLSTTVPYDTVRLTALPRDQAGTPLNGLGAVSFRSLSPERLSVTPDGVVRAFDIGTNLQVIAELATGDVVHADTIIFTVTNDPAPRPPKSLVLRPGPPDSTQWAINGDGAFMSIGHDGKANMIGLKFIFVQVLDADGVPIPEVGVHYKSTDTTVARVLGSGGSILLLDPRKPGTTKVIGSGTGYGASVADTVEFTVTLPIVAAVQAQRKALQLGGPLVPVFSSPDITIMQGGTVIWTNVLGEPVDIVFNDPTNVVEHGIPSCANAGVVDVGGVGDIPAFGVVQDTTPGSQLNPENCRSRRFTVPGVYSYHSTLTGATGRIVVTDGGLVP